MMMMMMMMKLYKLLKEHHRSSCNKAKLLKSFDSYCLSFETFNASHICDHHGDG